MKKYALQAMPSVIISDVNSLLTIKEQASLQATTRIFDLILKNLSYACEQQCGKINMPPQCVAPCQKKIFLLLHKCFDVTGDVGTAFRGCTIEFSNKVQQSKEETKNKYPIELKIEFPDIDVDWFDSSIEGERYKIDMSLNYKRSKDYRRSTSIVPIPPFLLSSSNKKELARIEKKKKEKKKEQERIWHARDLRIKKNVKKNKRKKRKKKHLTNNWRKK